MQFSPGFTMTLFLLPKIIRELLIRVIFKLGPQDRYLFQNRSCAAGVIAIRGEK